ncbi:MAG TPA: sensor domain-containing protein [Ktedonobacteraceae bacterium]|jgi:hypothetical protein
MEHPVYVPGRSLIRCCVFLIISLPVGLFSFTLTVTGLAVGLGTIVIWLGLPVLWLTLLYVRGMAEVERRSVQHLLGLPPARRWRQRPATEQGFLRHFAGILRDPYTWTSTLYMLLKLPLGILSFSLTLTLLLVSATLTILPLIYLLDLTVDVLLLTHGIAAHSVLIPAVVEISGIFDPRMFARTFIGVPVGVACWVLTRYVLSALAQGSGALAIALLGPGEAYAQPHQDRPSLASMSGREQLIVRD